MPVPGDRLGTPLLPRVGSDRFWEEQQPVGTVELQRGRSVRVLSHTFFERHGQCQATNEQTCLIRS